MKDRLKLASVDIGTNSVRLLIAWCDGSGTETLDRRMVITRLGEGVDSSGRLSAEAMERTVRALREYRGALDELGPASTRAVATSALREVENAPEFLDLAERVIGRRPEIIPGEREGWLSFLGAVSDVPPGEVGEGDALVFDIGGGSTELIVGDAHAASGAVERDASDPSPCGEEGPTAGSLRVRSVDVGCVRMSERFLTSDPPSPVALGRMESHIVGLLKPVMDEMLTVSPSMGVGLAGTVTTLSGIKQGLEEYVTGRIHHSRLTRDEVEGIFRKLASVALEERKRVMGLEPGRADVIVGGTAVLRAVMDLAGLDEILVSEKDILDGLIIDMYRNIA